MAQRVKDPALSLQQLGSLLWYTGSIPGLGISTWHGVATKKKKKKKKEYLTLHDYLIYYICHYYQNSKTFE